VERNDRAPRAAYFALTHGSDGGPLNLLVALASGQEAEPSLRQTARALLDLITSAMGLEPVGQRGELLSLLPPEVAQFEVREATGAPLLPTGKQREEPPTEGMPMTRE
jgi:hypothetical protein